MPCYVLWHQGRKHPLCRTKDSTFLKFAFSRIHAWQLIDLPLSLLFGLPALLVRVLPLGCRAPLVLLRERRGALGRETGPVFHESRCLEAALGADAAASSRDVAGTAMVNRL